MRHEKVSTKIQALPPSLLREVEDFIDFLLVHYQGTVETQDVLNPQSMTQMAAAGGAFDWLFDPVEENIYTDADGQPV